MNRPPELIAQLRILGRLADFGSGAQFGRRFRGADAHLRLHWHLRARCFVRRLKSEVLPQLPAKTRAVVPVELDNEAEYRLAERDVVAWLQSQPLDLRELDAKVAAALRAERLVRLNALKLLAARGKLHGALAWIHDFLSSGERLVVFAHHREIQRALRRALPGGAAHPRRDTPVAREAALDAFQAPDGAGNQLIVCSIERRRAGAHADALLQRRLPGARLDARQARPGRGPLPPHRPAGRGQRHVSAGGRHDRRDDRHAAGAQARGDRRRHRRPRGGRGGRGRRAGARAARRRPTAICARWREPAEKPVSPVWGIRDDVAVRKRNDGSGPPTFCLLRSPRGARRQLSPLPGGGHAPTAASSGRPAPLRARSTAPPAPRTPPRPRRRGQ